MSTACAGAKNARPVAGCGVHRWCWGLLAAAWALASAFQGFAAGYMDHAQLTERLRSLATAEGIKLTSLARSSSGKDTWLVRIELGGNPSSNAPAMLAVAGLEGTDLAGTAVLLDWIEGLATNRSSITTAQPTLVYVIPRLNVDAAETRFDTPRREMLTDATPVDDDHDGDTDEDGPDDLNGDGQITWMRVKDPAGAFIADPLEPRLMIQADAAKGEAGAWRVYPEGKDDDHDEQWNEDGTGGVNLNQNFPAYYKFFGTNSGLHPLSQPVARALADFIIAHPNIGLVFAYGAQDNLSRAPKAEAPKRPPTALHETDLPIYKELGKAWRETAGLKKELDVNPEGGSLVDWVYFHRGRLALGARAWTPAMQLEWNKASQGTKTNAASSDAKDSKASTSDSAETKPDAARNEEQRSFLKWLDTTATNSFVPWEKIQHADFEGREVEVGGFAPFALSNPPESILQEVASRGTRFLNTLPSKLPRIEIRKATVKNLGQSVFDITVTIANAGFLPTALAQGELSREVLPTRVSLEVPDAAVLSGTRRVLLESIAGSGGSKELRWIVNGAGRDSLNLSVVSALAGTVSTNLVLTVDTPGEGR